MLKNKAKEKSLNLYHHEKCPLKKFLLIIFRSFSFFQIEQKPTIPTTCTYYVTENIASVFY